ncbi:hypothetical protein PSPHG_CDS_0195 [Pseudomonas phage Psxphi15]
MASIPTHDGTAEPSLSNVCHIRSDLTIRREFRESNPSSIQQRYLAEATSRTLLSIRGC